MIKISRFIKALFTFSSLTVFSFGTNLASAQVCQVVSDQTIRSVSFPSGKKYSIVGHAHGVTSDVMGLARLIDDNDSPNEAYLLSAAMTLNGLKETLNQYRSEVAYLRKEILERRIQFIALEFGEQSMAMMTKFSEIFLPMSGANLKRRGLNENAKWIDDAFLVFAGPALYLLQTEPELMKSIKLVPVEDDSLMQKSLEAQSEGATALEQFKRAYSNQIEIHSSVEKLFLKTMFDYDLHSFLDNAWLLVELKAKLSSSTIADALKPLGAGLGAAELMRQRDAKSVKKLLNENGSGVLLIGSAHSRSMANLLKTECLSSVPK